MTPTELDNLWFNGEAIPGATFALNDPVRITNGVHLGELGSVLSLISLEPFPVYVVELGCDGATIEVTQTELERAV
jgi:hypothetical protein